MSEYRITQFNAILDLVAALNGAGATRKQIAEALGLKKSPNVLALIKRLVDENYLREVADTSVYPHRFRYHLPDNQTSS